MSYLPRNTNSFSRFCFTTFRSALLLGLTFLIVWLVLSRISCLEPGGGVAFSAELRQQWVNDEETPSKDRFQSVQPLYSTADKNPGKSVLPTIPSREKIEFGSDVSLFPTQITKTDPEDTEQLLAQRGLLSRADSSIRSGFNRLQTIAAPEEAGRANSNVRTAHYEWFDSERNRSVPVKVYYPINTFESCPTILFSHGLGGSSENCAYLGEYWAYNGYIAVFIHHYGSDDNVWKGKVRPLNELRNAYDSNWTGRARVQDIQFVLSQLEKYSEQQADFPLRLIDKNRLGLAGYDLGALATLIMVGQRSPEGYTLANNPQIRAVLAMSPPIVNPGPFSAVYEQIETPCLFITGTNDDGIIGTTKATQRRIPFDSISCNDQYLVVFDGTDHMLYAGHLISILPRARNDGLYQNAIARLSTNFWNAYLKADPNALEYMMSQNVTGLLSGLGRIERKFYLRERRDVSSESRYGEMKEKTPPPALTAPAETQENRQGPQYLSVPRSPYSENHQVPKPLRNTGSATPRRLPVRLP